MRLPEIILLLVSCNIHSFGNATKGIAAITQLTVQPLVEKLQIQWTPGNNGTPVEEFRVVLFNETKLLQNLSVGIQTNMTVDIEPCLSTTVQVCGINKKHGLRDCIYATEKSLPESFPAVLIFSIKNTPEVLGQLLNWSVVEPVNENCDPYYEVTYTDNIKGFERVNTKDMFLQTFNLPQGTLIQYTVRLVCRNSSVTGNETSVTLETEPPIEPNRRYFVVRPFDTHLQLLWNSSQKAKDFLVGYVNDAEEEKFYPSNTQTWIDLNVKQQCIPSIVWIFALKDSTQPSVTTTVATQLPGNFSRSPTDVRVFPDCGSLNVTWKLESHKDYLVQYYEVKLIESRTGIVTIKNISGMWYAFVNGLKCDAPYIVFVTAINACGRSFPTNPVHVMARKEVKPNDTKSLNLTVTTNQLVVKWVREQPTYVDVVYEVHLQQMNSSSTEADEFVSVRHNEVKFERLSPCMNYSVGITVKNPFGLSSEVVESARTRAPGTCVNMNDVVV
ncbi:hypothetical protein D915_000037 [Fasciola hepatica]|uniref:Fibronectin type-III domain-containing protein n=1 Tax=Fasciola hepatica TaxID=6192 RepID=A0A4E0RJ91_FASHE|nr:hypothetical protein D915_000037 [Fasciola hepatica]